MRKQPVYEVRNKMGSCLRILYFMTYKLRKNTQSVKCYYTNTVIIRIREHFLVASLRKMIVNWFNIRFTINPLTSINDH